MRSLLCAAVSVVAFASSGARAQSLSDASDAACPHGALSLYFASGDVTVSPQTRELIGRIGDVAASCKADGVDILAHFDARIDGDRAVDLTLERLALVAGDLVARGLSAERIRIVAQAGDASGIGFSQIDVVIRESSETPDEAASVPMRVYSANAI